MSAPRTRAPVYLDHNATTPVDPRVVGAMAPYWTERFHNPSSPYPPSAVVRQAIADARAALARLVGARPEGVVFTGGGTESDNWALRAGFARGRGRRRLVVSAIEHPAVLETAAALGREGAEVVSVPVDAHGVVAVEALEKVLDERVALVSVMLASNEIGTIQPVAEVSRRAHAVGALVHTDASQAVGKIPVDVEALGADLLTVAGHKLYAPKGVGALVIAGDLELEPLLAGGGQEGGRRSGTENVPAIVGLGEAARLAGAWLAGPGPRRQGRLRDTLESRLRDALARVRVFGPPAPRLPNTLAIAVAGFTGAELLAACPEILAGTGSACHHPGDAGSPTLRAMGVDAATARGLVRLSLGRATTGREVGRAAAALVAAALGRGGTWEEA